MSKKFPYGYDVNKYIDVAVEKMKYTFFWASRDIFDDRYEYFIEKIGNRYKYISIYHGSDKDYREVLDCGCEEFIQTIMNNQEYAMEKANPVKDVYVVPGQSGKTVADWHLERYEFRSHLLGGYSVFCQAGDRVAGGSRTFFIPNAFFKGNYDSFLDKYITLVPSAFGFTKEELLNIPELKKFLGY